VTRAIKGLLGQEDSGFKVASVTDVRIARDSNGRWWVSAYAVPASEGLETPCVVMVESHGRWRLKGYGTDIESSLVIKQMHISKSVVGQLFPTVPQ
jgi:hypothetical protein